MISISTRNTPIFSPIFLIKKEKESLERGAIMLHPLSSVRLDLIISFSSVAYFALLRWYLRVIDIQSFSASYTGIGKCINRASDLPRRAAERRGRKMCAWRSGKALTENSLSFFKRARVFTLVFSPTPTPCKNVRLGQLV